MKNTVGSLFLLLILFGIAHAQPDQHKLKDLSSSLKAKMSKEMPEWQNRSVEPIEGSKNTIIEQWQLRDLSVRVAITEYASGNDSARVLEDTKKQLRVQEDATSGSKHKVQLIKDTLPFLGDGGFVWNINGSEAVVFTKGNLLVSVTIGSPEKHYNVGLSRSVAKHVCDVLESQ